MGTKKHRKSGEKKGSSAKKMGTPHEGQLTTSKSSPGSASSKGEEEAVVWEKEEILKEVNSSGIVCTRHQMIPREILVGHDHGRVGRLNMSPRLEEILRKGNLLAHSYMEILKGSDGCNSNVVKHDYSNPRAKEKEPVNIDDSDEDNETGEIQSLKRPYKEGSSQMHDAVCFDAKNIQNEDHLRWCSALVEIFFRDSAKSAKLISKIPSDNIVASSVTPSADCKIIPGVARHVQDEVISHGPTNMVVVPVQNEEQECNKDKLSATLPGESPSLALDKMAVGSVTTSADSGMAERVEDQEQAKKQNNDGIEQVKSMASPSMKTKKYDEPNAQYFRKDGTPEDQQNPEIQEDDERTEPASSVICGHVAEEEVSQPLLNPYPEQRKSWKNCCGPFELFFGSSR